MVRDGDETTVAESKRRRRACSGGAINRIQNARSVFSFALAGIFCTSTKRERERERERRERNGAITTKTLVFRACVPFRGCVRELRHAVLFRKKREEIFVRLFFSFFLLRVKIFLLDALLATHAHTSCFFRCGALSPRTHLVWKICGTRGFKHVRYSICHGKMGASCPSSCSFSSPRITCVRRNTRI